MVKQLSNGNLATLLDISNSHTQECPDILIPKECTENSAIADSDWLSMFLK
jgi:hypothetical protein